MHIFFACVLPFSCLRLKNTSFYYRKSSFENSCGGKHIAKPGIAKMRTSTESVMDISMPFGQHFVENSDLLMSPL